MNKLFAVVLSVLFVVAAAAPLTATESRQIALGGVGNYIEDDYNIFAWPATLPSYSNMVWMGVRQEWGATGIDTTGLASGNASQYVWALNVPTYLGVSYGLGSEGEYGTVALFLYHLAPGLNPVGPFDEAFGMGVTLDNPAPWPGAGTFSEPMTNKFTLMYAYKMEKLSFGLYFNRSDRNMTEENGTSVEESASYTKIGGGIRFDAGEKAYMDIGADLGMAAYKCEGDPTFNSINEDANRLLGIKARIFYEMSETVTLVPFIGYQQFDFSLKADTLQDTLLASEYGDKAMMFNMGLGINLKVNEDNLLVFAIEPLSYLKYEPSELPRTVKNVYYKKLVMPRFFLALESDVKDWLTFRVGAMKELAKVESKGVAGLDPGKMTSGDFGYFMGLGFHVSDFDIDCVINNQLPLQVGYWLTGSTPSYADDSNNWPVLMASATYHF